MDKILGNFDDWQEILDILENGNMVDYITNPEIYLAWTVAKETNDFDLLGELLARESWIFAEAKKNIKKFPYKQPKGEELYLISGKYQLGFINKQLNTTGLNPLDFTRGYFVSGETGSGKTYSLLRLYDQILSIPIEDRGFNLLLIQIVKRDADFLIKKHPHLRIIEWENFRRNSLQVEPWDEPVKKINSFCSVFSSINFIMTMGQPLLKRAIRRCFEKKRVFNGSDEFPNFSDVCSELNKAADDIDLEGYEKKNICDKLKLRFTDFIDTGDILNCHHGYKIDDFWSKEDICLNVIDESSDYIYGTAVMDLIQDLQRYYEQYPVYPHCLRTLISIEESRSIFPAVKDKSEYQPNKIMEGFVSTARSSGLGRICVTQEPQSVSSWLTNNSAFFMTFPISGEAVDHIQKLQNLSDEQIKFLDEIDKCGTGIFRDRRFNRPYIVQVPSDLEIEPITEEEIDRLMEPYISKLQAQLRSKDEEIIEPLDIDRMEQEITIQKIGISILRELRDDPFQHFTLILNSMKKKYQIRKRFVRIALDWLKGQELITSVKAIGSKTRPAEYFPLTNKAQESLKIPASDLIAPSHFIHTLYCELVKKYLESQGYNPIREFNIGGERIDVYVEDGHEKMAFEIIRTISTVLANVTKCLFNFGVDQIFVICERQPDIAQAMKIIAANVPGPLLEKITFQTIRDYF